jgi:hypothetical protein
MQLILKLVSSLFLTSYLEFSIHKVHALLCMDTNPIDSLQEIRVPALTIILFMASVVIVDKIMNPFRKVDVEEENVEEEDVEEEEVEEEEVEEEDEEMKEIYSDVYDEDIDPETEAETEEEADDEEDDEEDDGDEEDDDKADDKDKKFVIYNKSQEPRAEKVEQPISPAEPEQPVVLESAAPPIETLVEKVVQEEPVIPVAPVAPVVSLVPVIPVIQSKPKYVIRAAPPMVSVSCDTMCSRPTKGRHPT